jgi:hypothetical protein
MDVNVLDGHLLLALDGIAAVAYAPNQRAADDAARKYWNNAGGWWSHRWIYWSGVLLLPILVLYVLGWAVAWIIAGFRSR